MKRDRLIGSEDKNIKLRKWAKSNMTKLRLWGCWKIIFTCLYISVLEEPVFLKLVKIKKSHIMSWMKYDGTKIKLMLTMYLHIM